MVIFFSAIWSYLYGLCSTCNWNNFQQIRRSLWDWSQSLVPLRGGHLLHHHASLDLLLSSTDPWLHQSQTPFHLPQGGADLHPRSHGPLHHRLHCHLVWVQLVLKQSEIRWISRVWRPSGRRGECIITTTKSFGCLLNIQNFQWTKPFIYFYFQVFAVFNTFVYGYGTYLVYNEYNSTPPELQ